MPLSPNKIPCTNCGAALAYKPNTENLVCPYCSTTVQIDMESQAVQEQDLREFLRTKEKENTTREVVSVKCVSCGAYTEFDDEDKARNCAFCGEHLLLDNAETRRTLLPQGVLPFKFEEEEAFRQYFKWISSRWLAPNKLKKKENGPAQFQTIYIPFWTFDAQTFSKYSGEERRY